jgi:hypothetical protein
MTTVHKDAEILLGVDQLVNHHHHSSLWFGASADQSGTDWALEASLTAYQAISGASAFGGDANDEAKVFGTSDMPGVAGSAFFDMRLILVADVSVDTPYVLRFVWGSGTMADAITAKQYTMAMVQFDATNPQLSAGIPVEIEIRRVAVGLKVWLQVKCATDNATLDFFVGAHGYPE